MAATDRAMKDRMIEAAVGLFSSKGCEATSVADIQVACGLTPSSGALYKHFPSKRALLEEVLRVHRADIAATRDAVVSTLVKGLDADATNLEAMLRLAGQLVWQSMDANRAAIRITIRDLEPYPDLLDGLWDAVFEDVYRQATTLIELVLASSHVEVSDPEATAAVLLSSLTYFPTLRGLIGRTPGDVDPERYLDAWVDHAMKTLGARR